MKKFRNGLICKLWASLGLKRGEFSLPPSLNSKFALFSISTLFWMLVGGLQISVHQGKRVSISS